jgi:5'-nucleotidase
MKQTEEFIMTSRRTFIKQSLAFGGLMATSPGWSLNELAEERELTLTILHSNDMHSRIDPFPANDPKYAGMGGMQNRANYITSVRKNAKNVLLLDCGDIFQGTPYFNMFGGEPEFKLMSMMKYDAATMGNHDFDNGLEGFDRMLKHADFPFICSNYNFNDTLLYNKTKPYTIVNKGPLKIGIIGIGVELKGLVGDTNYGNTQWTEPIQVVNKYAPMLKHDMKCNMVICLSHIGYSYDSNQISDIALASEIKDVDLILGGHTHTFLKEPTRLKNASEESVWISQAGWAGICMGHLEFEFEKDKVKKLNYNALQNISETTGYKS